MTFNLNTKLPLLLVLLFVPLLCFSQQDKDMAKKESDSNNKFLYDDGRQKSWTIEYSYQIPISNGDNFIGQAYDGTNGYNFRLKLFLYKQFFASYTLSGSGFDITDTSLVGNYPSTSARERFFSLGYEFLPVKRTRLGIYSSLGGRVTFRNQIENTDDNKDTGSLWSFGVYSAFEIYKGINLFVDYSFRRVNTDIEAPAELQSFFEKGQYNTLNFGVKFYFGNESVYSAIKRSYKKETND